MTRDLLREGLSRYSSGDLAGAARLWLELVKKEPDNEHARSYLERVRELKPALLKELESAKRTESNSWASNDIAVESGEVRLGGPREKFEDESTKTTVGDLEKKLHHFMELDDFTDARGVAHTILESNPEHQQAKQAIEKSEEKLEFIFESKIGNLSGVPTVLVPQDKILWLDLDNRAGFVLSQVDGVSSYDEILLVTGMGRVDALRILARLVQDGVIGIGAEREL